MYKRQDQARSTLEFEKDILDGLHWLGLAWDEGPEVAGEPARGAFGPYRQSQRLPLYKAAATRLLADGKAYHCYCTPEELEAERTRAEAGGGPLPHALRCTDPTAADRATNEAGERRPVIRFRIGEGVVAFDDVIRGHVEISTQALGGDFVIARADGSPLFHFTNVVDDIEMHISHVIRGEDHLSNVPKHILLFRALGAQPPIFAHLPLILNADRSKMSKRKSQTAIGDYRREGFIRETLVNYLALLGWSSGTAEELFGLDELVARFELEAVNKAGAVFDRERLEWLNGQWIRRLPTDELGRRLRPYLDAQAAAGRFDRVPTDAEMRAIVPLVHERLPLLSAIGDLVAFLFVDEVRPDPAALVPKRWDPATAMDALGAARDAIEAIGAAGFEAEVLELRLRALAESRGWKPGDLFMTVRVAVTGRTATPPIFDTLVALGIERTLERLDRARRLLAIDGVAPAPTGR